MIVSPGAFVDWLTTTCPAASSSESDASSMPPSGAGATLSAIEPDCVEKE
ncbi:MAG: hypothetical protein ACREIT_02680 [Tepidisphaeraceae bacterium]